MIGKQLRLLFDHVNGSNRKGLVEAGPVFHALAELVFKIRDGLNNGTDGLPLRRIGRLALGKIQDKERNKQKGKRALPG